MANQEVIDVGSGGRQYMYWDIFAYPGNSYSNLFFWHLKLQSFSKLSCNKKSLHMFFVGFATTSGLASFDIPGIIFSF